MVNPLHSGGLRPPRRRYWTVTMLLVATWAGVVRPGSAEEDQPGSLDNLPAPPAVPPSPSTPLAPSHNDTLPDGGLRPSVLTPADQTITHPQPPSHPAVPPTSPPSPPAPAVAAAVRMVAALAVDLTTTMPLTADALFAPCSGQTAGASITVRFRADPANGPVTCALVDAGVVALVEEATVHSSEEAPRAVRSALMAAAAAPAVEQAEGVYVCEVPEASSAPQQQQQQQQLAVALLLGPCDSERCAALVAHPTTAVPSSRISLNVTAAPLEGGVAVRIFGMTGQTDDAAIHCVFTDAAGASTTSLAAVDRLTSEEAATGARAATCVAPATSMQGTGTVALYHTCRALTVPLAFHYHVAPVVTALEETAGPRFGTWTAHVRVSSALRPALAALASSAAFSAASPSPAALRCQLVSATSGTTVAVGTATLVAEGDGSAAASSAATSRVQCALGSDVEPLPAGLHRLQLWLGGRALAFAEGETGEMILSGPRVAMTSSHQVVTDSATYTAIALELTAPAHGTNRAQVSAKVNVTVGGRPCEHVELLHVAEQEHEGSAMVEAGGMLRPPTQFSNTAALVRSDTVTWAAGQLGVRHILVNMDTLLTDETQGKYADSNVHDNSSLSELELVVSVAGVSNAELSNANRSTIVQRNPLPTPLPRFVSSSDAVHLAHYRSSGSLVLVPVTPIGLAAGYPLRQQAVVAYRVQNASWVPPGAMWPATGVLVWEPSATPPATQYAPFYVSWDRIPLHAQYPVQITLEPVAHALVGPAPDIAQRANATQQQQQAAADEAPTSAVTTQVKLLLGVPEGSCPPGAQRDPLSPHALSLPPPPQSPRAPPSPPAVPQASPHALLETLRLLPTTTDAEAIGAPVVLSEAFSASRVEYSAQVTTPYVAVEALTSRPCASVRLYVGNRPPESSSAPPLPLSSPPAPSPSLSLPSPPQTSSPPSSLPDSDSDGDSDSDDIGSLQSSPPQLLHLPEGTRLSLGPNVLWVVVTGEDGWSSTAYRLEVTLLASPATAVLQTLLLRTADGALLPLTASFQPDVQTYQVELPRDASALVVEAQGTEGNMHVEARLADGSFAQRLQSTVAAVAVPLRPAPWALSPLLLDVTSEDGVTTRTYTVQLSRQLAPSPPPPLPGPPLASSSPRLQTTPGGGNNNDVSPALAPQPSVLPPPQYPQAPALAAELSGLCTQCAAGTTSSSMDALECSPCPMGASTGWLSGQRECLPCLPGTHSHRVGSAGCGSCPVGSFAMHSGATVCELCPVGYTSTDGGNRTACDALVEPEPDMSNLYGIVVDFRLQLQYNLTGSLTWEHAQREAGLSIRLVNDSALVLAAQLIRMDTAEAFSISNNAVFVRGIDFVTFEEQRANAYEMLPADLGTMAISARNAIEGGEEGEEEEADVNSTRVAQLPPPPSRPTNPSAPLQPALSGARRMMLDANVTAVIEVEVSLNATHRDIAAAIAAGEVNADKVIQVLSESPDAFFGRTTTALEGKAKTVGNITTAVVVPRKDDDSDFFDSRENVIGLSLGLFGGLLLVGVLGSRLRRRWLRKRLTMHASFFIMPSWSNPLTIGADDASSSLPHEQYGVNPLRFVRTIALYSHLPSRRKTGDHHDNTL